MGYQEGEPRPSDTGKTAQDGGEKAHKSARDIECEGRGLTRAERGKEVKKIFTTEEKFQCTRTGAGTSKVS